MNLFQVFALMVVGTLFVLSVAATVRGSATRREGLVWALVWLAAAGAIAWPATTGRIAKALGIGRGADLVLYSAVVVMLVGFLMVYVRIRRMRRELTLIVRHLAIREAAVAPPAKLRDPTGAPAGDPEESPAS